MPKTILLIEDDFAIIDVYTIVLESAGFKVETITLGAQALEKMKEIKKGKVKKPDLLLLDLILPDMNGIDILKAMRKEKETKDIAVFVLTNYTDRELEKMGYNLKSEKHLLKTDYTPTQLVKLIKKRLKSNK